MAYTKTVWKNRIVQKPGTYTMISNGDGTITLNAAEGTIVEAGTPVNAENMNKIENALVAHETSLAENANEHATFATQLTVTGTDLLDWADKQTVGGYFFVEPTVTVGVPVASWFNGFLEVPPSGNKKITLTWLVSPYSTYICIMSSGVWSEWTKLLTQSDYDTLFQYANDGKTGIANAVTAKGVTASPSDTFTTLASKIGQIATGKKFAIGQTKQLVSPYRIEVNGLNFTPEFILAVPVENTNCFTLFHKSFLGYYNTRTWDNYNLNPFLSDVGQGYFNLTVTYGDTNGVMYNYIAIGE